MTEEPLQGRDQIAVDYLRQMQELASEIVVASHAISVNQMQDFRQSVERQEQLCSSLVTISKPLRAFLKERASDGQAPVDVHLEQRIRAACLELKILDSKYAALLKHSGRSIALLSLMYKSLSGEILSYGEPKRHTCSYEV